MPRNEGIEPPYALVDIRYRSGVVVRNVAPNTRRWSINDPEYPANYAFDIRSWQRVGSS